MGEETKAVEEGAKAVQEVAKTVGKALEITEKAGPFLERVLGPLVDNAVGVVSDRIGYYRLVQFYGLVDKVQKKLADRGVDSPQPVPPKLAVPLLEAATIEDSEVLHDLWSEMLTNFMDPNYAGSRKRAFVTILQDLEPGDVAVLASIYGTVLTKDIDTEQTLFPREAICEALNITAEECEISLLNLMRHGCVMPGVLQAEGASVGGHPLSAYKGTERVKFSALGMEFARACTPPTDDT